MDIVKHCLTAAGCPSGLGAHKIGQQAFPGLNLVSQATGVQKVKSASDWSIAVPRAPGNTSTHSNDTHKQTKFAMAEGSVSSSELSSPSIFTFIAEQEPDNEEFDSIIASLPPDFAFDDEPHLTMPITPPTTGSSGEVNVLLTATSSAPQSTLPDSELKRLKDKNKNKNTEKSTNTWVRRFTDWLEKKKTALTLHLEIPHPVNWTKYCSTFLPI